MKDSISTMTLTDINKMDDEREIGPLPEFVTLALEQNRLTCGVYECAKVLESSPDDVMLCILPACDTTDVSVLIQHKLIEAYCWENDIHVFKMVNSQLVQRLLKSHGKKVDYTNRSTSGDSHLGCILLQYPEGAKKEEDLDSSGLLHDDWLDHIVELPV